MPGSDKPGADLVTIPAGLASIPRFRALTLNASGQAVLAASTKYCVGVSYGPGPAAVGQGVSVLTLQGVGLVEAGAAVAAGATVSSDATGRAIAGTGLGITLEAAAAAGQIISVLFGGGVLS